MTPSKLIWEISEICGNQELVQKNVDSAIQKKLTKYGENEYIVSDAKNTLQMSAFFLLRVLNGDFKIGNEKISGLANFIVKNGEGAGLNDLQAVLEVGNHLSNLNVNFPVLRNKVIHVSEGVINIFLNESSEKFSGMCTIVTISFRIPRTNFRYLGLLLESLRMEDLSSGFQETIILLSSISAASIRNTPLDIS